MIWYASTAARKDTLFETSFPIFDATCLFLTYQSRDYYDYYDKKNNIIVVLVSHVDNLLYAAQGHEAMNHILEQLKISRMHAKDLTYL